MYNKEEYLQRKKKKGTKYLVADFENCCNASCDQPVVDDGLDGALHGICGPGNSHYFFRIVVGEHGCICKVTEGSASVPIIFTVGARLDLNTHIHF